MAKLYPSQIPDDAPSSERKVFNALVELPNAYSIFHSVNWLDIDKRAKQRVGETDLVIIHPKHGILVVEVKGGRITSDGESWFSTNRHDQIHRLARSPAVQARENLFVLRKHLEAKGVISRAVYENGLMGYAVWFTDGENHHKADLPLDLDHDLVLDGASLFDPEASIERSFAAWRSHPKAALDKQQIAKITQLLAPAVNMMPSLGLRLKQQEKALLRLTGEQQQLFSMIQSNSRLLVSGGAGTGKTLLAIEDAKYQAKQGRKTLFLCFNKLLAEHLVSAVEDEPLITAASFHHFSHICCDKAGVPFEPPSDSSGLSNFFKESVPELLVQSASLLGEKYDALIVDEGQDFLSDWWIALDELLEVDAVFHCFYDSNQAIFQDEWEPPFSEPVFGPLKVNCRNTAPIGEKARTLGQVKQDEEYQSIEGVDPEMIRYKSGSDLRQQVKDLLYTWIDEGKLDPTNIVILSPYKRDRSKMGIEKIGKWKIYDLLPGEEPKGITFSTIHAFKGLEADAIIISDLDGSDWSMNAQALYVAASRAKHLLAVCAGEGVEM